MRQLSFFTDCVYTGTGLDLDKSNLSLLVPQGELKAQDSQRGDPYIASDQLRPELFGGSETRALHERTLKT